LGLIWGREKGGFARKDGGNRCERKKKGQKERKSRRKRHYGDEKRQISSKTKQKGAQMDGFDSFWGLYRLIEGLEWLSEGVSHRKIIAKSTKILENHQFWTISKRFQGVLRVQISHQTAKRKEKGTYSGFERPICSFIEGLGVFSMGFRGILPRQID
jgi:hypothetical protein